MIKKLFMMTFLFGCMGLATIQEVHADNHGTSITSQQNGWKKVDAHWYYYQNGQKQVGWQSISGTWYYLNPHNGQMATNWLKENNTWYFLGSDGSMKKNWQKVNGTWYFFNNSGKMLEGWQRVGQKWYFLTPNSGAMKTGWLKQGSIWYLLHNDGAMAVGFNVLGGATYYFNSSGIMQTGWESINHIYYNFNASGAMRHGWFNEAGTWYFLNNAGQMQTNWLAIGNTWYFLNSNGAMHTGFLNSGKQRFYLKASGDMARGNQNINGVSHNFANNGELLGWTTAAGYEEFEPVLQDFKPYAYNATVKLANSPIYNQIFRSSADYRTVGNTNSYLNQTVRVTDELITKSGRFVAFTLNGQKVWTKKEVLFRDDFQQQFVNMIKGPGETVMKERDQFASVMLAQAILESGFGQSTLASQHNNFFGIKAPAGYPGLSVVVPTQEWDAAKGEYITIEASFKKYLTLEESFADRALFLEQGGNTGQVDYYYGAFRSVAKTYQNATLYLTGRYATSPTYNVQLNNLIEYWELYTCD
ncbi:glucosaminidase domain-containing protein [Enterococcus timonensis]|uniref:glucosaminidase domain-containing protein n=1 Tax=Enterococcus timonensis TaxID=1852364 RepID=UPI0008D951B7|nr:glucosaminidase domain-containing protein [Enterococcus timonensis]